MTLCPALLAAALGAAPAPNVLVFCSPGSPGTTAEAQPRMDALAAALRDKAGVPVAAVYHEAEDAGVARMKKDAAGAFVSLPFFLKHEKDLGLRARLGAAPQGREPLERWALVAKKGRVASAAALAGMTIASTAGFAPAFVRGPGVGEWGPLPSTAKVTQAPAVLSALRRAAAGEDVAVLLDGVQAAALPSLPFAADLEVVARSAPLPAGVVASVRKSKAWNAIEKGLLALPSDDAGRAALEGVQLSRFAPLDEAALGAARKAYGGASR